MTAMNTWLLPMAIIWRWWRRIRRYFVTQEGLPARADNMHHHPVMNAILTAIFTSELPFVIHASLPFGLSLIVLGKKDSVIDARQVYKKTKTWPRTEIKTVDEPHRLFGQATQDLLRAYFHKS